MSNNMDLVLRQTTLSPIFFPRFMNNPGHSLSGLLPKNFWGRETFTNPSFHLNNTENVGYVLTSVLASIVQ